MGNKDTTTACQYANQFFTKETNEDKIEASDYLMHAQACGKGNPDVIVADLDKVREKDPEQAVRVLKEALDDARKAGNRALEGELSLILFKLQGANANPQNLVSIGTSFYYGGNLKKADSLFQAYTKSFPDSIFGYYWSAKALVQQDTAMTLGLAVPSYDNQLRIAETNPTRDLYRSSGTYAAAYLAAYNLYVKKDRAAAQTFVQRGLAITPTDSTLLAFQKALQQPSPQQKTSTSNNAAKTETKTKTPSTKTKTKG
jgi:tetratricopeptide (TPR) repeat protein